MRLHTGQFKPYSHHAFLGDSNDKIVVDVRTGQWEMYLPQPLDDRSVSSLVSRRDTHQTLVTTLKDKAYIAAADDLLKRFGR